MNGIRKEPLKLDSAGRAVARQEFWAYHGLMLFAREVSSTEWKWHDWSYEHETKPAYQTEFRDHQSTWQKAAKNPSGDGT